MSPLLGMDLATTGVFNTFKVLKGSSLAILVCSPKSKNFGIQVTSGMVKGDRDVQPEEEKA